MGLEVLPGDAPHHQPPARAAQASLAERIKADANRVEFEVDATGRKIGVRALNPVDLFEVSIMLGADVAGNQAALMQAMVVCSVVEIDADPVARPTSMLQLTALMKRLGFHGIAAVNAAMSRFTMNAEATTDAAKN